MYVATTMDPISPETESTTGELNETVHTTAPHKEDSLPDLRSIPEFRAYLLIGKYYPPVLMLLGGFGNVATIFVLRRINWGQSTQHVFLTALAVVDLCLLCTGPLRMWVWNVFGVEYGALHVAGCKLLTWFTYSLSSSSAWLLTTVTAQRAMSVVWPHRISSLCNATRSGVTVACILLASLTLYSKHLFHMEVNELEVCEVVEGLEEFDKLWQWIDLVVASFLPSVILLVCNITLAWTLCLTVRKASMLQSARDPTNTDNRKKVAKSMTILLMSISIAFILLTLPVCIFLLWDRYVFKVVGGDLKFVAKAYLAFSVTHMLWYTNSAVNFLLYCVSGTKFRNAFVTWITCGRCRAADTLSHRGQSNSRSTVNTAT